jgi:hypothetical protein
MRKNLSAVYFKALIRAVTAVTSHESSLLCAPRQKKAGEGKNPLRPKKIVKTLEKPAKNYSEI